MRRQLFVKRREATVAPHYHWLKVCSPAFKEHQRIPARYTGDGGNQLPPLHISGIPRDAKTLAVIVEDKDAPFRKVNWVAWNIPVTLRLNKNTFPVVQGKNDFGLQNYQGPRHPRGMHRYTFKIFALNEQVDLPPQASKDDLLKAISGKILALGELTGKYERKRVFDVY